MMNRSETVTAIQMHAARASNLLAEIENEKPNKLRVNGQGPSKAELMSFSMAHAAAAQALYRALQTESEGEYDQV